MQFTLVFPLIIPSGLRFSGPLPQLGRKEQAGFVFQARRFPFSSLSEPQNRLAGALSAQPGRIQIIMKIVEIAFTGYSVTNMKRAKAFYEGLLGLQKSRGFGKIEGEKQWVEYDIGPSCLALISSGGKDWPPSPDGTAAAFEVDDFAGYAAKLKSTGVKFIIEPTETPMCHMTVIADPDGNRVVLHQRKPRPRA